MRRLRGVLDAVVLIVAAAVAAPWCALFPDSWERLLDHAARHVLFVRSPKRRGAGVDNVPPAP